jgi:hypothetical protein
LHSAGNHQLDCNHIEEECRADNVPVHPSGNQDCVLGSGMSKDNSGSSNSTLLIVAIIVGVCILIALIVVIFLLLNKRSKDEKYYNADQNVEANI